MKKVTGFLLTILFVSTALFAQDVDKIKKMIEEQNSIYTKAMIDNDTDKMLSMYTDDIISMPSYQPMVKGIANVRELSEMQANSGWKTTHFVLSHTDVIIAGDLAIEVGNYDMKMSGPGVPEWADNGKYITIWEMQKDGSIKIKVETWNTDHNPWQEMQHKDEKEMEKME